MMELADKTFKEAIITTQGWKVKYPPNEKKGYFRR